MNLYVDVITVLVMTLMASILQDEQVGKDSEGLRWVCVITLACTTMRNICLELLEMLVFFLKGHFKWYLRQGDTFLDWTMFLLTLLSMIGFARLNFEYPAEMDTEDGTHHLTFGYRLVFASAGMLAWLHVLKAMKGFKATGKLILPILSAVSQMVPFSCVMLTSVASFVHAYYAMGLKTFHHALLVIYRLGILGDFDRVEMAEPQNPIDENPCETPQVTQTRHAFADLLLVLTSVALTVVLMNILIGVLSESYNRACESRENDFFQERARINLYHFSMSYGWSRLCRCRCRSRPLDVIDFAEDLDFVWFVRERMVADDVLDVEYTEGYTEGLQELRREMAKMHDELMQRQVGVEEQVLEKLQDIACGLQSTAPGDGHALLIPQPCSPLAPVQQPGDSSTLVQHLSDTEPFIMAATEGAQLQTAAGSQIEFQSVVPGQTPLLQ